MTTEATFIERLVAANFAADYYTFCAQFRSDLPFTQSRPRGADIVDCLQRLQITLPKSKVDRSFAIKEKRGDQLISRGFVFQSTGNLECFFGWQASDKSYVGGNFCEVAENVQTRLGLSLPKPPYPRPQFCGEARLFDLMSGWYRLDQILAQAAAL